MSYLNQQELLQTQDTWKRSQVRLPPSLHQAVVDYANDNKMSLNTAIVELLDLGLNPYPRVQTSITTIYENGVVERLDEIINKIDEIATKK